MLLYTTAHCFCREPFRQCLVGRLKKSNDLWKISNVLWIPILLCIPVGLFLGYTWINLLTVPNPKEVPNYEAAVNTVILSICIEALAEPLFVMGLNCNFISLKVIIEGIYNVIRSSGMMILVCWCSMNGINAFCYSQVLASVFYFVAYYVYFWIHISSKQKADGTNELPFKSLMDIFPKFKRKDEDHFPLWAKFLDQETIILVWSFYKQTLWKQMLTEGEKYLMTVFNMLDFAEQGAYEIVNNLGSIPARLIFLPIEESARNTFSSLLKRGPVHTEPLENVNLSISILQNMFKLVMLIGCTGFFFGIPYSQTLLFLYGGQALSKSKALHLLQWFWFYTIFLAMNGITESFAFSVITPSDLDRRSSFTLKVSLTFLFLVYFLTKPFGAIGFILANCVNMALRTGYSLNFIKNYFDRGQMKWFYDGAVPSLLLILVYVLCSGITLISDAYLCCSYGLLYIGLHISVGFCCLISVILILYFTEEKLVHFILPDWFQNLLHKKRS